MTRIKRGIDPEFVRKVAEEEMEKASGRKPSTYSYQGTYTIGEWGGNIFTGETYGALVVNGPNNEVRVVDTGHYSGSANAARYAEKRLRELGLTE